MAPRKTSVPFFLTLLYIIAGVLWILFSDQLLSFFISDRIVLEQFRVMKDLLPVVITAALVYIVLKQHAKLSEKEKTTTIRLASIVESSDDAIIGKDLNSIITSWNIGAEKIFGYSAQEMIGTSIMRLIPDERQGEEIYILDKIRKGERLEHIETVRRTKDGTLIDVSITVSPIMDESRKVIGVSKIARNITRRKQREKQIAQMKRLYATLSQVNQTIVRVRDRDELFRTICNGVVKVGEFSIAWIGLLDESTGNVAPVAAAGIDLNNWPFPTINIRSGEFSGGIIATALRSSEVIVRDAEISYAVLKNIHYQHDEYDLRSVAAVPFHLEGKTIGVLSLVSNDAESFAAHEEVNLFEEMGMDITHALEMIKHEKNRSRNELQIKRLNRVYSVLSSINHMIIRSTNRKVLFDEACTIAVKHGEFPLAWIGAINDKTKKIDIVSSAGLTDPYLSKLLIDLGDKQWESDPAVVAIKTGTHAAVQDISAEGSIPVRAEAVAAGYHSAAAFPLKLNGTVVGVFKIYSGEPGYFDTEELTLIDELVEDISFALTIIEQNAERETMEKALRENDELFRQLTDNISEVFWMTDIVKQTIVYISPAYEAVWGRRRSDLYASPASWLEAIHPDERGRIKKATLTKQAAGDYDEEYRIIRPDGSFRWIHDVAFPVRDADGTINRIVGVAEDITEKKKSQESKKSLEAQLQQAQKLESLGTLASGIAHDFNNILGIVIAHASLIRRKGTAPEQLEKSAEAILNAGNRGAGLVKQMLTFARKTEVKVTPVNVNEIVIEVSKLLSETFPKMVTVSIRTEDRLPRINADPTQLHQVLLNLCVNARDAMPDGGTLTITTSLESGSSVQGRTMKEAEDEYVVVSVRDTGMGIDEATKSRIFEPFFTTKELGKGTGLGLSLIFGIMENHHGFVEVESTVGEGTEFKCYFPVVSKSVHQEEQAIPVIEDIPGGGETILLVEDEQLLLDLLKQILEAKGYTVLTAMDGEEGVKNYCTNNNEIDLVISDMGLPKLEGYEMFKQIKAINPGLRLIFASGFIEPEMKRKIEGMGVNRFIQKPYQLDEVLQAVRAVLDKK